MMRSRARCLSCSWMPIIAAGKAPTVRNRPRPVWPASTSAVPGTAQTAPCAASRQTDRGQASVLLEACRAPIVCGSLVGVYWVVRSTSASRQVRSNNGLSGP